MIDLYYGAKDGTLRNVERVAGNGTIWSDTSVFSGISGANGVAAVGSEWRLLAISDTTLAVESWFAESIVDRPEPWVRSECVLMTVPHALYLPMQL